MYDMYGFSSQIISYILNMLICIDMILVDNLLQYLLFITMIDLFRTYSTTASLICNALLIFMIYSWIKIKLKILIFPTLVHDVLTPSMHMATIVSWKGDIIGLYIIGLEMRHSSIPRLSLE
jgi:hypothetical protein